MEKNFCLLYLCTGNAARSVMAKIMSEHYFSESQAFGSVQVLGAGTHVLEGHPASRRVQSALSHFDLSAQSHRSRQLDAKAADQADLIVAFEPFHINFVRKNFPLAAHKAATLKGLVAKLGKPSGDNLKLRLQELNLAEAEIEPEEELEDPAGGDDSAVLACAKEIKSLLQDFLPHIA